MLVIKMNGQVEEVDYNKIIKQLHKACKGLNASPSRIGAHTNMRLKDGIHTSRIQEILIETTKSLITEESPDYSIAAARLINHKIRKHAYGQYEPPHLSKHIARCVELKKYDPVILEKWNEDDLDFFNKAIDHDRDNQLHLAGMNQFTGKYLMRLEKDDISTIIETPQMVYMMIAITLKHTRQGAVELYEQFSQQKLSIPTPIMAGVRSPTRQYSSCVLVDTGDSLNSINHTTRTIVDYVSDRAGIGANLGRIRGLGSKISHGEKRHTGVLPFLKYMVAGLKSCSQGGVRGGAATVYFPLWHWEIQSILTWKNNRGTEENRERRCDYGIQINDTMIQRLYSQGFIYLFDPHPELYEAYFKGPEQFEIVYNRYIEMAEKGEVRFKKVKAYDLWKEFVDARFETGRYYPMWVDNTNHFSPFGQKWPVYMSNLCMEVALPTKPAESLEDPTGIVSLCTLLSINMGKFTSVCSIAEELPETVQVAVEALDDLLSYQDFKSPHAKLSNKLFRPLGIGVVNLAYFLAKNGCSYGSAKGLDLVNMFWASMYYHGKLKSIQLAKQRGPCEASDDLSPFVHKLHESKTNLTEVLGVDTLDDVYDWDYLEEQYKKHGIRNATLFAVAPTESSSQLLNATNGIEMPRGVITIKGSKDSVGSAQVIPEPHLKAQYDFLWEQKSPRAYIETAAVIGRWCDQSISTNTPYNPAHYPEHKIPRQELLDDMLYGWSLGLKTFYYNVIHDNATDVLSQDTKPEDEDPCGGGACII